MTRDLIFVSYSHADEEWLVRLRIFFKAFPWGMPYKQGGQLWADPYIRTGEVWRREVGAGLIRARIAVLLVSQDFLASDFIRDVELPALLEAASLGEVTLVCVPVRSSVVDLALPELLEYQWAHPPEQPMDVLGSASREAALAQVFRKIYELARAEGLIDFPSVGSGGSPTAETVQKATSPMLKRSGMLGKLFGAPNQRPHFVPRPELRGQVKSALLSGSREAVGVTGPGRVGVYGQGGLGKTVTAIDIVQDEEIRLSFPDGVYWLTLGQSPHLIALQSNLIQRLAEREEVVSSVPAGIERLRELLAKRACLIVLDDVWRLEDAQAFDVANERTRLLITTRDSSIITALDAASIELHLLDEEQALRLLAGWSGRGVEKLGREAKALVARCGYLPLAIAVAGALLRDGVAWSDLLAALQEGNVRFLEHPFASVFASLRLSLNVLSKGHRERYLELAVVPEDVAMPVSVIETLWAESGGLTILESRRLVSELHSKSLLYLDGESGALEVRFHDLQRDFLYLAAEDLPELHDRLLVAFEPLLQPSTIRSHRTWWTLPASQSYLWNHLAHHLAKAGRFDELRRLLLDYRWIAEKLRLVGAVSLLADFELSAGDPVTDQLRGALRLAAHVIDRDLDQLPSQLKGRLAASDGREIESFLAQIELQVRRPWLCPVYRSLAAPGGALIRTLEGHGGWVQSVAVTPDGQRVVSGLQDKTLKVWDLASGALLHTFKGHSGWIYSVAVTPDGKRAVSGAGDNTLKVWDLASGALLHTLEGHGRWIFSVAVTPDGKRVVSGAKDNTLKVWDLASGASLHTFEGHSDDVYSVAVTPDGERIVSGSRDNTLKVWDLASGVLLSTLRAHGTAVTSVAVTPDGKRAVTGSYDQSIKVWDLASGILLHTLEGHSGFVKGVAVTPDGSRVLSGSGDRTLRIWDLLSGVLLSTLVVHDAEVSTVAVMPDGERAVTGSQDGTLKVWNLATDARLNAPEGHRGGINGVAVTPDGKRVVSGADDRTLKVWSLTSGELLQTLEGHVGEIFSVAVTPDGERVVSGSADRTLRVWDIVNGVLLHTLQGHSDSVSHVSMTTYGDRVVSGSHDGTLKVWDLASGLLLLTIEAHAGDWVHSLAVIPDGARLVSSDVDTLKVWDLTSGALLHTLEGHDGGIFSVAATPTGERLVGGSSSWTLHVWDMASGKLLHTLKGHDDYIHSVAINLNGQRVASASNDRSLKLWDLATERCIATFTSDTAMTACAALPNGEFVAGDALGRLHILKLMNA